MKNTADTSESFNGLSDSFEKYVTGIHRSLEEQEWAKIKEMYQKRAANTWTKMQGFQRRFPNSPKSGDIRKYRNAEENLKKKAIEQNCRQAYLNYKKDTHLFLFDADQEIRREQDEWSSIKKITPSRYNTASLKKVEAFLKHRPNSEFASLAQEKIRDIKDKIAADKAAKLMKDEEDDFHTSKTIVELKAHLERWPNGRFEKDAKKKISKLEDEIERERDRQAFESAQTIADYRHYLNEWDGGQYRDNAREEILRLETIEKNRLDDLDWQEAINPPTHIFGLNEYLKRWPEGRHVDEAREAIVRIEESMEQARFEREYSEWKAAMKDNTIRSYRQFAESWPDSDKAVAANKRMEILVGLEKLKSLYSSFEDFGKPRAIRKEILIEHPSLPKKKKLRFGLVDLSDAANNASNEERKWLRQQYGSLSNSDWALFWGFSPISKTADFFCTIWNSLWRPVQSLAYWAGVVALSLLALGLYLASIPIAYEVMNKDVHWIIAGALSPFLGALNFAIWCVILVVLFWASLAIWAGLNAITLRITSKAYRTMCRDYSEFKKRYRKDVAF